MLENKQLKGNLTRWWCRILIKKESPVTAENIKSNRSMIENRKHLLYKKQKKPSCGPYPRKQTCFARHSASSRLNYFLKGLIFYQGCLPTGHMVSIEYLLVSTRLHSPTTSSQHFCFTEAEWGELSDGEKGAKTSLMEGDRQVSHFHTNCFKAWFFNHF